MNKLIKYYLVIIVLLFLSYDYGIERIRLSGLIRPESIAVDKDNIYITDSASVKIFSKIDYKLISKFGRKGNGPQEFALFPDRGIRVSLAGNKILVNSVMKLSFWTKKGEFLNSIKPVAFSALYLPIGKNYIGSGRAADTKARYKTVNIYNSSLEPVKEIMRSREPFQPGVGLQIAGNNNYLFEVGVNKIFTCSSNDFEIEVFDENGKKIRDIKRDFKRVKITEKYKKQIIQHLKTDRKFKEIYHVLKPVTFGSHFAAIESIKYNDKKLYIMPGSGNDMQEIMVLNTDGKFLKTLKVQMKYKNVLKHRYPFVIVNGKLYQIAANSDDEEWDLLVFDLEM